MSYTGRFYRYTVVVYHLIYGAYFPLGYNGTICEAKRLAKELNGRLFNSFTGLEISIHD